jgi:hypothetical protein
MKSFGSPGDTRSRIDCDPFMSQYKGVDKSQTSTIGLESDKTSPQAQVLSDVLLIAVSYHNRCGCDTALRRP